MIPEILQNNSAEKSGRATRSIPSAQSNVEMIKYPIFAVWIRLFQYIAYTSHLLEYMKDAILYAGIVGIRNVEGSFGENCALTK